MSTSPLAEPVPPPSWIPQGLAFTVAAITFTSVYLATGALTPLLVFYREEWDFPATQLTLAFAVYAVGFLAALLTLGSLSDYVGRRPVLIGALVVQVLSNLIFLLAPNIEWVITGRIVQGIAQGAATTAFTAALVEWAPESQKRLGAILGSVGVTMGLGLGSLLGGLAIEFTGSANSILFIALTTITILGGLVIAVSPDGATRTSGAWRSLIPRASIPGPARGEFIAAAPVIAAAWMLAGLSGGLAPSMVSSVFHLDSGLLNGVAGFIAPAASAVVGLAFVRVDSRLAMTMGIYASMLGAIGIIGGVLGGSLLLMFVGQAIAGVGFGASFTAALRLIVPLVASNRRAGVVTSIYIVSYLALGIPIIVVGQLTAPLGVVSSVVWYSAATILLALISLVARIVMKRRAPDAPRATSRTLTSSSARPSVAAPLTGDE